MPKDGKMGLVAKMEKKISFATSLSLSNLAERTKKRMEVTIRFFETKKCLTNYKKVNKFLLDFSKFCHFGERSILVILLT